MVYRQPAPKVVGRARHGTRDAGCRRWRALCRVRGRIFDSPRPTSVAGGLDPEMAAAPAMRCGHVRRCGRARRAGRLSAGLRRPSRTRGRVHRTGWRPTRASSQWNCQAPNLADVAGLCWGAVEACRAQGVSREQVSDRPVQKARIRPTRMRRSKCRPATAAVGSSSSVQQVQERSHAQRHRSGTSSIVER